MLTLQFIATHELNALDEDEKVKKILNYVKANSIVVMEGKLKAEEEASLIKFTMGMINNKFKGVEIATINPDAKSLQGVDKLRVNLASFILGRSQGLTVIGPATIIKEIKRDPNKIKLFTKRRG
ncbi:MAG: DUF2073 domain-containing protein [Nanoarchaeota archaeon]|nr:DUF2073 domain-containing protein [Nanoarchaeota archaeon]MBU0962423.1 DUF2073 domain-containing protein [Nanoarchaeota archaeon]